MDASDKDPILTSWNDCIIRRSDFESLGEGRWLTDRVITFFFERIFSETCDSNPDFLFVGPEVTQLLKMGSFQDFIQVAHSLDLEKKRYVFFAINDNEEVAYRKMPLGTHWSLMVYSLDTDEFYHFDSINGHNRNEAFLIAARCQKFFLDTAPNKWHREPNGKECDLRELLRGPRTQRNGYDCGLHVIFGAYIIAAEMVKSDRSLYSFRSEDLTPPLGMRGELHRYINEKAKA